MNDFETAVAKCHNDLVKAGHSWAQPRGISIAEKVDGGKLPHEWILKPNEPTAGDRRRVVVLPPTN